MKAEKMIAKMLAAMTARGWDQKELARSVGLPEGRVTKWKSTGEPTARQALAIARALGVSLEWLADDTQDYPPPPSEGGTPSGREVHALLEVAIEVLGREEVLRRLLASSDVERPQPQSRILGNAVLTDRPQRAPSEGFQRQHESRERPD
jgi:transcriptional regulator with XRE-family HTH domain